jgi:hypothetical protein
MTTRLIHITPTMPHNSPRITPDNRDLPNHTPLPSTYRTIPPNPTTTPITAQPLTASRIQHRLSGMARPGLRSVSQLHRRHRCQRHPFRLPSADRNLRPLLHLRVHLHLHLRLSAYMLLPPSHSPTQRHGEPQGHPKPLIRLPNPSASRGRKKLPFLGIPHRWRRQLRWILISGRHALFSPNIRVSTNGIYHYMRLCACVQQLIESYRIIIDTTNALSNEPAAGQGRPPSLEALQRISQSAALGLRLLGSTVGSEPPGTIPPAETPGATPGSAEEGDVAAKRQARYAVHLHEA